MLDAIVPMRNRTRYAVACVRSRVRPRRCRAHSLRAAIPATKAYRVYARWTAHPNRATDAKYTITHAGGDTTVTVDQEQANGAWVQLGTFTMSPSAGHKISLTDQANGYVIADAIRLIATDEPEYNSATWTPNQSGQYEIYAKWTANPNRATNATYTVTHAGGATPITVNQQANGGAFNLLGTFTLTPTSTITLTDNADGYVIADAIQLIFTGPAPQQMYFIHTDHLNTPRVITNQAQQVVWRWDNEDAFGNNAPNENPSNLGNFTCNLRLPGQYFDRETNLHYNYFRDYDPAIGRYVQSDPIGLRGGINTFGYVGGNPISDADFFGLAVVRGGSAGRNEIYRNMLRDLEQKIINAARCCPEKLDHLLGVFFDWTVNLSSNPMPTDSDGTVVDHNDGRRKTTTIYANSRPGIGGLAHAFVHMIPENANMANSLRGLSDYVNKAHGDRGYERQAIEMAKKIMNGQDICRDFAIQSLNPSMSERYMREWERSRKR